MRLIAPDCRRWHPQITVNAMARTLQRRHRLTTTLTTVRLGCFLIALAFAVPAVAQSVVNPSRFEFDPSADHNTITNGVPVLSHYELEVYSQSRASLVQSIAVGKPSPEADGKIRIDFATVASSALVPNELYLADVVAVGPAGRAASSLAPNSFYFACAYSLSALTQSVAPTGGSGVISVTSGTGCAWTATETASWLTITGGASGSGIGAVTYTASANTSLSPRTATLVAAGVGVVVTQAGAGCTYQASPTSQSVAAGGGTAAIAVTAATGCAWTATETAAWLTITTGASGSGNGTIGYTASANTSTSARTATLMAGGTAVTITQAGAACSYGAAPDSQSFTAAGGTATVAVTAGTGCAWTTSEDAAWLTIVSAASGSADGTISYTAAPNTSPASRVANLTVAGRLISVTQAGSVSVTPAPALAGCSFVVAPENPSIGADGGAASLTVTTTAGCNWTAVENARWLDFVSGWTGSTTGTASYRVAPNSSKKPRSTTLTVAGRTVIVSQDGKRR